MKIRLLFSSIILLAACFTAAAQYTTIDFETPGVGGTGDCWTWRMDQNADNPLLEFIANPVGGGINTSETVAKFTARAGGQTYALTFTDDIDPFQFDATNSIVKIMVYKTVRSRVTIKFEGASTPFERDMTTTLINEWEELTFNFSGVIGNNYNRLIVIPDFEARTQENIMYFDNIQIPTGTPSALPPAAPTPIHDEVNNQVISIFSDSYTDVAPGAVAAILTLAPNHL